MEKAFKITNSQGGAISIEQLDKEAAIFWGCEPDRVKYATPYSQAVNWFDCISWAITNPVKYTTGWDDIKCTIWSMQSKCLYEILFDKTALERNIEMIIVCIKPYYNLIDHWESKGYIPVKLIL